MKRMLCLVLAAAGLCGWAAGEDWHNSLYLGNGGWWHKRVPVAIHNGMARDAAGDYASLRVGTDPARPPLPASWPRRSASAIPPATKCCSA